MVWLKRVAITIGVLVCLLLVLVIAISVFGPGKKPATTLSVAGRTVGVVGDFKTMRQDAGPDGFNITVDGHEITIGETSAVVDGETRPIEDFKVLYVRVRGDRITLDVIE